MADEAEVLAGIRSNDMVVEQLGSYGGKWSLGEAGWRVEFDARNAAFPFAKVEKQFANGAQDGIYSFFTAIPFVFPALRPSGPRDDPTPQRTGAAEKRSLFQRLFGRGPGR